MLCVKKRGTQGCALLTAGPDASSENGDVHSDGGGERLRTPGGRAVESHLELHPYAARVLRRLHCALVFVRFSLGWSASVPLSCPFDTHTLSRARTRVCAYVCVPHASSTRGLLLCATLPPIAHFVSPRSSWCAYSSQTYLHSQLRSRKQNSAMYIGINILFASGLVVTWILLLVLPPDQYQSNLVISMGSIFLGMDLFLAIGFIYVGARVSSLLENFPLASNTKGKAQSAAMVRPSPSAWLESLCAGCARRAAAGRHAPARRTTETCSHRMVVLVAMV